MLTNIVDDIYLDVLYEDKHLIICVKPMAMPSQPDLSGQTSLLSILEKKYKDIKLVHRLDTMTGGVMVFAKNSMVAGKLSGLIQDHSRFIKKYLAITEGSLVSSNGTLEDILFHDKMKNKTFVVDRERKDAKQARLSYQILASDEQGHTLNLITLMTGRSHQIRAQFASRGCPVFGDGKYGAKEKMTGFALWSYGLEFVHPILNKKIVVYALPDLTLSPWSLFDDDQYC